MQSNAIIETEEKMTNKLELYKCNICNNMVEIVLNGYGKLVCCDQEMELLIPNIHDGAIEKHVPVVEDIEGGKVIKVGSAPHPMEPEHYIQFIEVISSDEKYVKREYLYPGEEPKMELKCNCAGKDIFARENCNIHGLWSNK